MFPTGTSRFSTKRPAVHPSRKFMEQKLPIGAESPLPAEIVPGMPI
jgi:hypothetical protein